MVYTDNTGGPFAGVNTAAFTKFVESSYKWSDPPRWFKANDPYWYQLDNLPLKQIHENCQWLKDQIEFTLQSSGVGRSDFNELRPYSVGSDRRVRVLPGNFIGRVNDAYNKGIATYEVRDEDKWMRFITDVSNKVIYTHQEQFTITLRDQVFASLIGYDISTSSSFPSNGLFDTLQFHQSENYYGNDLPDPLTGRVYARRADISVNTEWGLPTQLEGLLNLPKVKLALWRGASTNYIIPGSNLQQRSVEFTRRWGGVVRTAVVNSPDILNIEIPDFKDEDFTSNANYVPQVRIDLVFMYTHPVDSKQSYILENDGNAPTSLTQPKLGIVKGAGIVSLKNQGGLFSDNEADIESNPYLVDTVEWQVIKDNKDLWYNAGTQSEYNLDNGAFEIRPNISDQRQALAGFTDRGVFGSFPSPDDLMNLAPYLQASLEENNYALLGQSILPIAYVVVKKGADIITQDDIIDIRPFFRTAELAYNERAGITAANPPLSLANPAVGRIELQNVLHRYGKAVGDLVQSLPDASSFVGGGGSGGEVDIETSSFHAAFSYGSVTYGPAEYTFSRKHNGTGTNLTKRLSVPLPQTSGAVMATLRGQITQTATTHSSNDSDEYFGFQLLFYDNEGTVLGNHYQAIEGTGYANPNLLQMGHGRNGNYEFMEIGPVAIPTGAQFAHAKVRYSHAVSPGHLEGGDQVTGLAEYALTITYSTVAPPTFVTTAPG